MKRESRTLRELGLGSFALLLMASTSGCSVTGPLADEVNPFAADGTNGQQYGERNTNALLGGSGGGAGGGAAERARHALEVAGSYDRTHAPQPVYPVIRPAEVRLMWIPDHQTTDGNLVPAHYYYLKVLHDDWELRDAFEIEGQLHNTGGGNADFGTTGGGAPGSNFGGATPWSYKDKK
jgi:hypothetical protein